MAQGVLTRTRSPEVVDRGRSASVFSKDAAGTLLRQAPQAPVQRSTDNWAAAGPERQVARVQQIVAYGDFNCPWSYLASRRLSVLAANGVEVDWRAVEHEPWRPRPFMDSSVRFLGLRAELEQVSAALLPDEQLPYSLAGFVPYTAAAVSGYAEAYGAGQADLVRNLLFEATWVHGVDVGDPRLVRTLLVDAIRSGSSPSDPLREWGYSVGVNGGPITTTAWRLIGGWLREWQERGDQAVPVLLVDGATPLVGLDAVEWLGTAVAGLGSDAHPAPGLAEQPRRDTDLASLSWVSETGNRWMRAYQQAHRAPLFPELG